MHETVNLRQPKPRSLPDLLRGEERTEDLRQQIGRNAGAGVAERDRGKATLEAVALRVLRLANLRERQRERTAVRHGIARIDRDVDDGELQLGEVDFR